MENAPSETSSAARKRRLAVSYRLLLAVTILCAAVGAPVAMRGAVYLAQCFIGADSPAHAPSLLQGVGVFALSASPLCLAGYTWKRTQGFQEGLDRDS